MNVIEILRLLRKHLVLLLFIPLIMALLVTYFTRKPTFTYSSVTILYTGIASGSSVEMDKSFSFFANNTAFDNLINVIKSRETLQEVAIRLLAQHLMLDNSDPKFISRQSYINLESITPDYVKKLVVKHKKSTEPASNRKKRKEKIEREKSLSNNNGSEDTTYQHEKFSFSHLDTSKVFGIMPASIDPDDFEQTVTNLTHYMAGNDTNFIYKLLNFNHPHYSILAISSINVLRIGSSDLVKVSYSADEPGICQQTLAFLTEVCMKNYKNLKENRSDAVVKYFEFQVKQASVRLKIAEDKLLKFNEDNNIINYYEQSKAVANVKEDLDVDYHNKRIKLAGFEAAISRIEEKLGVRQQIMQKNSNVLVKLNQLADLNYQIANIETIKYADTVDDKPLKSLKEKVEKIKEDITTGVNDLYSYSNSIDGLPVKDLLQDWITNVISFEETKAGLTILGERIKEFQKQYAIYAPAGANLKRIEREISVSEQEFLEILHGLNLAKLKMQDAELSSNIKAVDPPYFPLSPDPTKRKMLIIIAALLGFLILFTTILVMEYFDETLKNPVKASKILGLSVLGIFPKIFLKIGALNFLFVTNRLVEMVLQQIERHPDIKNSGTGTKTLVFISTLSNEGKTIVMGNIARKMKKQGKKILVLVFSRESLRRMEVSQTGYPVNPPAVSKSGFIKPRKSFAFLNMLLGYPDTRIDPDSPFLQKPKEFLNPEEYSLFNIDTDYFSIETYPELLEKNNIHPGFKPDYILIEIPALLFYSYPPVLIANSTLPILVCRSNRIWRDADRNALETFVNISGRKPPFLLNGVELNVIEYSLGELIKKRSWLRRMIKKTIRFEFFSRHQP